MRSLPFSVAALLIALTSLLWLAPAAHASQRSGVRAAALKYNLAAAKADGAALCESLGPRAQREVIDFVAEMMQTPTNSCPPAADLLLAGASERLTVTQARRGVARAKITMLGARRARVRFADGEKVIFERWQGRWVMPTLFSD